MSWHSRPYVLEIQNTSGEIKTVKLFYLPIIVDVDIIIKSAVERVSYEDVCNAFSKNPIIIDLIHFEVLSEYNPDKETKRIGDLLKVVFEKGIDIQEYNKLIRIGEINLTFAGKSGLTFSLPMHCHVIMKLYSPLNRQHKH